jgi:protease-4
VRILWRLLSNLVRIVLAPLWLPVHFLRRPRAEWVRVSLSPGVVELPENEPLWKRLLRRGGRPPVTSIDEVISVCEEVSLDPRARGVVFEIPPLASGWAVCASLRAALARPRTRGKRVAVYLPLGGGNREMFVAAAAERVYLGPHSTVALLGLAARSIYFGPLLDAVGVEAQVQAKGEYKTAAEGALRSSMSGPQREQLQALLASFNDALVDALLARPALGSDRVPEIFAHGLWRADRAVEQGLADGRCYEDELPRLLAGGDRVARAPVTSERYLAWRRARLWRPVRTEPYIAVIPVHGVIGLRQGLPGRGEEQMLPVVAALRRVRADGRARGAILHVNSPGGSALASDQIHREVCRLKEKMPVVACLGDVAASGGYYVAAPAHRVVAQPVSVTGSIGVISAAVVAEKLLDRLGVKVETLRTAPHADMFWPTRRLTEEEEAIIEREMTEFYGVFLDIVAEGRKMTRSDVEALAGGRIWSGADALQRGLVDRAGGLPVATAEVRELLTDLSPRERSSLKARRVRLDSRESPPPAPLEERSTSVFSLLPELEALARLAGGRERILYYAHVAPVVD